MEGYGICFNEWLFNNKIKNELKLLIYISSLCATKGYCYASNAHFADKFDTTKETISRKISKLEKLGYISSKLIYQNGTKVVKFRQITLLIKTSNPIDKNIINPLTKISTPLDENVKDNITSNNNTNNNNPFIEIISFLNKKLGTNYKSSSKETRKLIKARLKEGFTIEDFKTVISKKANEWLFNKDMSSFLRPQTLFGSKFESYLNKVEAKEQTVWM